MNELKLWVSNIPDDATIESVNDFFKDYDVKNIALPESHLETATLKSHALVTLNTKTEAERAFNELDGKLIGRQRIRLHTGQGTKAVPGPFTERVEKEA